MKRITAVLMAAMMISVLSGCQNAVQQEPLGDPVENMAQKVSSDFETYCLRQCSE